MADLIDVSALGHVVVIAAVAAIGVVGLFATALALALPAASGTTPVRGSIAVRRAAGGVCVLACAAVVIFGLWVMLAA